MICPECHEKMKETERGGHYCDCIASGEGKPSEVFFGSLDEWIERIQQGMIKNLKKPYPLGGNRLDDDVREELK